MREAARQDVLCPIAIAIPIPIPHSHTYICIYLQVTVKRENPLVKMVAATVLFTRGVGYA